MDFFGTVMAPFRWLVSAMMAAFHDGLNSIGMPAASGWTWTLSIIGIVLVVRAALIPVFLKQVNAQQRMRLLQPDLKKLQEKYKGKTDPLSRQAMVQEQMALYKAHGTNPFSACLPMLIQMPFFFALFQVLSGISTTAGQSQGVGAMSAEQVMQFDQSTIFGAPLSASLLHGVGGNQLSVWVLSIVMILAMTAAQFITQKQIMARTLSDEALASPVMAQQKVILYSLPVVFGVGGIVFPIGVLIYWTTTNLWTMGQQFAIRWDRMGP
ncbi:membrane protein insertase YidC [Arthrobacter sp. ES3-54]|uniref:membrane protein insertase YidC n=1 Tax=Arthrobacter sp. ES3-54 TaxID=1502991 RepID=UPI0024075413|nr:membrane protein insertase YidC [Arthrobacter sp. ES3-54]MDF9751151.1 YidC/Oxa1 family membrane protein insertase [Arthrobacter sp. ES3-54]